METLYVVNESKDGEGNQIWDVLQVKPGGKASLWRLTSSTKVESVEFLREVGHPDVYSIDVVVEAVLNMPSPPPHRRTLVTFPEK